MFVYMIDRNEHRWLKVNKRERACFVIINISPNERWLSVNLCTELILRLNKLTSVVYLEFILSTQSTT